MDDVMELNAAEIALLATHWQQHLVPGVLREAFTPKIPHRLVLGVRTPGQNLWLHLSLTPRGGAAGHLPQAPPKAPNAHPFAMLLRKHLGNAPLAAVRTVPRDRILIFDFARADASASLVAELTGHHSNLYLIDATAKVLGSFYPERAKRRGLASGTTWSPPPQPPEFAMPEARFAAAQLVDAHFGPSRTPNARESSRDAERQSLCAQFRRAQQKTERLVENLQRDLAHAAQHESLRSQADVLQMHLPQVPKGAAIFATRDFTGAPMTIPLDPALDAVANMQRMYDKARRWQRALATIEARLQEARERRDALAQWQQRLSDAASPAGDGDVGEAMAAAKTWWRGQSAGRQRGSGPGKTGTPVRLPYREYRIAKDRVARVGRSARDNDALTLHHARPWDLWLHVRGAQGSHVVVSLQRGEVFGQDELIDAAHLAAHFSSLRHEAKVEVSYALRRYVQKPKGFAPGMVRLLQEKTFVLQVDAQRLRGILARSDAANPAVQR